MDSRILKGTLAFGISLLIPISVLAQAGKPAGSAIVAQFQGTVITQDELTKAAAQDLENLELERIQFNAWLLAKFKLSR